MQASPELKRLVAEEVTCGCGEDELADCRESDIDERCADLESYRQEAKEQISSTDIRMLSKMGDETRFTILGVLEAADSELCFCEITPLLDVSESAVSHALSDLRDVDLIRRKKRGRWRYYELTDRAERILDALAEPG
jgi:ArsR family transcriptional regulator